MAYQPFDLTGQVALITGGSRGIGLGMAEALAAAGADIAIWSRDEATSAAAVEKLRATGVRAEGWIVDVADEAAVVAAMAATVERMGRVDSVFANAGIGRRARGFTQASGELLREIFSVNVDGLFFTLREGARHMIARAEAGDPGGSLVGLASLAAIEGASGNHAYGASKGAVVSLIKAIAADHARYGIRANAILPGWIATDMTEVAQGSDVFTSKVISRVPVRRWGTPEDFGGIAVYLASRASAFHTGDLIVVDGGYAIF